MLICHIFRGVAWIGTRACRDVVYTVAQTQGASQQERMANCGTAASSCEFNRREDGSKMRREDKKEPIHGGPRCN
jgi:hypothetical protein